MNAPRDARLPALDGVRGIAILMVMTFHFWGTPFGLAGRGTETGLDEWAQKISGFGWSGVDLFFVLSGFLITGILYDAKNAGGFFRTFYARRALRIVPVYYVFLLFVLLVAPFFDGLSQIARVDQMREIQFWFWTYLVNIGSSVRTFDVTVPIVHAHFWSLAVEEQFYLVWPFVVLAFGRRSLMGVCVALAIAALLFRVALTEGFASDVFEPNAAGVLMPARMDTLALGAFIALAARGKELETLARFAPAAALIAGAAILGLFIRNDGMVTFYPHVATLGYTSFAVLYAAFLVIALGAAPGSVLYRFLTLPAMALFGRYSYAMYVVHLLVSFELARQFIAHDMTPLVLGGQFVVNIVFVACAMSITLGIAWVSWHVIEQPFLRLKSRFTFERARADQSAGDEQPAAPAVAS